MHDQLLLYISAAADLMFERDLIGRAVADVPIDLNWRIVHSPVSGEKVDAELLARADLHLLLLASDIRAPVGQEWLLARRAGRQPVPFLKQEIVRTPAAQSFLSHVAEAAPWRPFSAAPALRRQVWSLLADVLWKGRQRWQLSQEEQERLRSWQREVADEAPEDDEITIGGAGESSVLLSRQRFRPSSGVVLDDSRQTISDEES